MATLKSLILACLNILCISISYSQWIQTEGPEGGYTNDMVKIDNTLIVTAGGGGVYISTNNGTSWEPSNEGLPLHPHVLRIASHGDNVYLSLSQRGVYRSVDKGSTWSPANKGADRLTFYSLFANGQEIYAGSSNGTVYYSPDQGANWVEKSNGISGYQINGFVSFNSKIYAGTSGGLFESNDSGDLWEAINIPGLSPNGIRSMNEYNGVFYVASDGQMFVSNDNLASWALTPLGSGSTLNNVVGYNNIVYTTTSYGRYYYSIDSGVTWTLAQNSLTDNFINDILMSNGKFLMTTNEGIFESFDGGASWAFNSKDIKAQNISALAANNTYLFVGTSGNGIFRSSDNGATWIPIDIGSTNLNSKSINDIIAIGNTIFVATPVGIFLSNDNGNNWVIKLEAGVNKAAGGLDYDNGVLATIIEGEGVYTSSDLGETWTLSQMEGIAPAEMGYVSILIRDQVIVVSSANGELFASTDLGQTWSNISIPDGFFYTHDLEFIDNRLYAATSQGVMASDDFGETWYRFLTYGYNSIQDIIVIDNTIYTATDFGFYVSEEGRDFLYPFTEGTKNEYITEILIIDDTIYAGTYASSLWSRPLTEIIVPPLDDDNDEVINEDDLCPSTPWGSEVDSNGCSPSQLDDDNDGVTNDLDLCPNTAPDIAVNNNGCNLIASNAISIYSETPSCPNIANGSIEITTSLADYTFDIAVRGEGIDENFTGINLNKNFKVENLAAGTYEITVAIPSILHEQFFGITINGPTSISGKFQGVDNNTQSAKYIVSGSKGYTVNINGIQKNYFFNSTEKNEIEVYNLKMSNEILISGINDCQGIFMDTFSLEEEVLVYPTITSGLLYIVGGVQPVEIRIYNSLGQIVLTDNWNNLSEKILHLDNYTNGIYIVHIITEEDTKTFKIVKK